jgi:hypothetical protein
MAFMGIIILILILLGLIVIVAGANAHATDTPCTPFESVLIKKNSAWTS